MGSGFPNDRPVDDNSNEILDKWGEMRLREGCRAANIIPDTIFVLTGGLRNRITGKTVAEVSYKKALNYIKASQLRIARNISQFELSTRGDILQAYSTISLCESVESISFVTEQPHWNRVKRIAEAEALPSGFHAHKIQLIQSGAPTPWWYAKKENFLNWIIKKYREESFLYHLPCLLWDFIEPIFLNMPRKLNFKATL